MLSSLKRTGVPTAICMAFGVSSLGGSPSLAQPPWLDYDAFFTEDRARIEAALEPMMDDPTRLWREENVDVLELLVDVLRRGSEDGREHWACLFSSFYYGVAGLAPEYYASVPVASEEFRYWLDALQVPSHMAAAEAREAVVEFLRDMRRFRDAVPSLLVEEDERRGAPENSDGFGCSVIESLLWIESAAQVRGTEEARRAAVLALKEHLGPPEWERRGFPTQRLEQRVVLDLVLEELPEASQPNVVRELDPVVRAAAAGALYDEDHEVPDLAAGLLAQERPLAAGSAELVYEARCAERDNGCNHYLEELYRGPDDSALEEIRGRVEARVLRVLEEAREERRAACERRSGLLESVGSDEVGGEPRLDRKLEWTEADIREASSRLDGVLGVVERMDSLSPELLESLLRYWTEERDPRAQAVLEGEGALEADALDQTVKLGAVGDCLSHAR